MNLGKIIVVVASFYVAVLCGAQSFDLMLKFWDPFFYYSVTAITPIIKPDECFIEELDVQRYRICKVDIDRFAIEAANGNVVFRERVPGGASSIGRNLARNVICKINLDGSRTPWPVGKIRLLQNVHSVCIDGTHSMQWPIMNFEVRE